MKKLNKLTINLNKVIKNEELVNLRGGYGSYGSKDLYECFCGQYPHNGQTSYVFEVGYNDIYTAISYAQTACKQIDVTCYLVGY
jgi:hypothetical protein